jgi:DNA-binding PadR family transcriptional regulator
MFSQGWPFSFEFASRRDCRGGGPDWTKFANAFGFRGPWSDEPRTRRGDVKFLLLELLAEQPRHGYELIKELERRHGGFYRPSAGSVYPTLQLLEEGGYLTSEMLEGKRVYTITDSGRQLLAEGQNSSRRKRSTAEGAESVGALMELKDAMLGLAAAVMETARPGNQGRVDKVRAVLERSRREIYRILAED